MVDAGSARVEIQPSANGFNAQLKSQEALLTGQEVSVNYGTSEVSMDRVRQFAT